MPKKPIIKKQRIPQLNDIYPIDITSNDLKASKASKYKLPGIGRNVIPWQLKAMRYSLKRRGIAYLTPRFNGDTRYLFYYPKAYAPWHKYMSHLYDRAAPALEVVLGVSPLYVLKTYD